MFAVGVLMDQSCEGEGGCKVGQRNEKLWSCCHNKELLGTGLPWEKASAYGPVKTSVIVIQAFHFFHFSLTYSTSTHNFVRQAVDRPSQGYASVS